MIRQYFFDHDRGTEVESWGVTDVLAAEDEFKSRESFRPNACKWHDTGPLLIFGNGIRLASSVGCFAGFPECHENQEKAYYPDTHSYYRGLAHNPGPIGHDLLSFEIALISLSFAIGFCYSIYAVVLYRRGNDGGAFLASGYLAALGLFAGIFGCSALNGSV